MVFTKENNLRRIPRLGIMEASSGMAKTSTTAGGEVRRIHIIYFLSHLGRIDHPHLIRLHHFNRNGVYLRDVKRWLADLRGKDMPEAFSWSYKRRYKNGYVWQDLLDDDLITPISDNEYVLKGSDVFAPAANPFVDGTYGEKDAAAAALSNCSKNKSQVDDHAVEIKPQDDDHEDQRPSPTQLKLANQITSSRKTSLSEISQESPMFSSEISTATDDSIKEEEEEDGDGVSKRNSHDDHQPQIDAKEEKHRLSSSSLYSNLLGKKKEYYSGFQRMDDSPNSSSSSSLSSSASQPTFAKSKSYSSGTSKMLRNLITCGNVDTNDAALIPQKHTNKPADHQVCKREALQRSRRVFGTPWNQPQLQHNARFDEVKGSKKQQSRVFDTEPKVVSPAYKTVAAPICSQCGKSFRPEKLHSHMKSCKGLKALTKASATCVNKAPSPSHVSVHSPSKNGYFLTN